jgi:hypothetical protein
MIIVDYKCILGPYKSMVRVFMAGEPPGLEDFPLVAFAPVSPRKNTGGGGNPMGYGNRL